MVDNDGGGGGGGGQVGGWSVVCALVVVVVNKYECRHRGTTRTEEVDEKEKSDSGGITIGR